MSTMTGLVATTTQPDPVPSDNSVVAGWVGGVVFLVLMIAVAVIARSLVTRLKNVDKAAEKGLYDPTDPRLLAREKKRHGLSAPRPPVN